MSAARHSKSELMRREQRPQLNVIVSSEMKDLISEMAKNSGQSMGQIVERLLDRAITYDKMLDTMKQSMAEIRRGNIETAFRAEGYAPVRSPYGTIWVPKEYPIERSRFLAQHEVEKIERERSEREKGEP